MKLQANGEPLLYATLGKEPNGEVACWVSRSLLDFLDGKTKPVVILEVSQARRLSNEREAAAFNRAVKDADCCVKCTEALQKHYDTFVNKGAEHGE